MPETTDTNPADEQQPDDATTVDNTEVDTDAPDDATVGENPTVDEEPADEGQGDDPEQFPKAYVVQLRKESAGYRERAQQADQLAHRLHTALVAATGRLADSTDLPFDQAHLDDADALTKAIDDLLERKPHLKSRRVVGDVGQGAGGVKAGDVDLAAMLRARA